MKKAQKKKRAVLSAQEVSILLRLPDDSKEIGLRDKVLLSLMYASGARTQETCDLTVGNIQFNIRSCIIPNNADLCGIVTEHSGQALERME